MMLSNMFRFSYVSEFLTAEFDSSDSLDSLDSVSGRVEEVAGAAHKMPTTARSTNSFSTCQIIITFPLY